MSQQIDDETQFSDIFNSSQFAERCCNNIKFLSNGIWIIYNSKGYWELFTSKDVLCSPYLVRQAKQVVIDMNLLIQTCKTQEQQFRLINHIKSSSSRDRMKSMIELSKDKLYLDTVRLDSYPLYLNLLNGVYDLHNDILLDHSKNFFFTKQFNVRYDPTATYFRWLDFLFKVFDSDVDLIEYIQRICGYIITGSTDEHAMFILHGFGQNGKSVFIDTLSKIFADYACTLKSDLLLKTSYQKHSSDITLLQGRRLAIASEIERNSFLDESLIKHITSSDPINARYLYKESFNFYPTHHLFLVCNHLPQIKSNDYGMLRRIVILPFKVKIPEEERIYGLSDILFKEEASGILNWMIQGYQLYRKIGLQAKPKSADLIFNKYSSENNQIFNWLKEKTSYDSNCKRGETAMNLYKSYVIYSEENHEKFVDKRNFKLLLEELGYVVEHSCYGTIVKGLGFKGVEQ